MERFQQALIRVIKMCTILSARMRFRFLWCKETIQLKPHSWYPLISPWIPDTYSEIHVVQNTVHFATFAKHQARLSKHLCGSEHHFINIPRSHFWSLYTFSMLYCILWDIVYNKQMILFTSGMIEKQIYNIAYHQQQVDSEAQCNEACEYTNLKGKVRKFWKHPYPILPTPWAILFPLLHLLIHRLRHECFIWTKPILNPAEKPTCSILSKGIASLGCLNGHVRMADDGRGN